MGSEDKYDFYLRQPLECLLLSDAGITHPAQSAQKRSGLGQQLRRRLGSAAAAFAMIGLSEVGQFEIDRERFRHLMRVSDIQTTDNLLGTFEQALLVVDIVPRLGVQLAMLDH